MRDIGSRGSGASLTWPCRDASIDRMRLFLSSISLLALSLSGAGEWLYYKQYPWVYDNYSKDWLYLRGSSDGKIYAYRSSNKSWEEFGNLDNAWNVLYEKWKETPEKYGGLETLELIKDAKDYGRTELDLWKKNISDLTPLSDLTSLEKLILSYNPISDITPLSGLSNLKFLNLDGMGKTNPEGADAELKDLSPLKSLSNLETLVITHQAVSDISPLSSLSKLEFLSFQVCNVSDLSPLSGLTKLKTLNLINNSVTDISPLTNLTQLENLYLGSADSVNNWGSGNVISTSQKTTLETALPITTIEGLD